MPKFAHKPNHDLFFHWSKQFETGIRIIDMDHRSLVDVVNDIHNDWKGGHFETALPGHLNSLFKYCTEHFFREEKIMEQYAYPDARLHKERHRGILRFVHALRVVTRDGAHKIDPERLLKFLQDWLVNHIGSSDMAYVEHIQHRISSIGTCFDHDGFEDASPIESIDLTLRLHQHDVVIIQQVAEILRGKRGDALEIEQLVERLLNSRKLEMPLEKCEALVHDLLQ